jgi:hypothetical protein
MGLREWVSLTSSKNETRGVWCGSKVSNSVIFVGGAFGKSGVWRTDKAGKKNQNQDIGEKSNPIRFP